MILRQRLQCSSRWTLKNLEHSHRCSGFYLVADRKMFLKVWSLPAWRKPVQHWALQPGADHLPWRRSSHHQGSLNKIDFPVFILFVKSVFAQMGNRPEELECLAALWKTTRLSHRSLFTFSLWLSHTMMTKVMLMKYDRRIEDDNQICWYLSTQAAAELFKTLWRWEQLQRLRRKKCQISSTESFKQ